MKKFSKAGLMTVTSAIRKIVAPHQGLTILVATAALLLPASKALGNSVDLTVVPESPITGDVGGTAIVSVHSYIPTGTGVFDPFLTVQRHPIEEGYNTSVGKTGGGSALPLDDTRPQWNHDITKGQLQVVTIDKNTYYCFDLDANETGVGSANRFLSIDNIRIYTGQTSSPSTSDVTTLGTLRFSLNGAGVPDKTAAGNPNWIKIDSSRNDSSGVQVLTSGSGSDDMLLYIPTSALKDAADGDNVYFYNLNGIEYAADDGNSADAGFEEWNALTGPNSVPDGGNTLVLFGSVITALGFVAGRRKLAMTA